ncbi:MAG: ferrodoxin oxidoreductase beta subunit [Psychromonas sp.]
MKLLLITTFLLLSNLAHSAALLSGSKSLGVKLSGASIDGEYYSIAGISFNYFAIDNLSVGGSYEYWFSGSPTVYKATAESTYYVPASKTFRPYFGILYSHYFIEDDHDIETLGYRVGVAYMQEPLYFSGGIKQEYYLSDSSIFSDEDMTVEFMVGLEF